MGAAVETEHAVGMTICAQHRTLRDADRARAPGAALSVLHDADQVGLLPAAHRFLEDQSDARSVVLVFVRA